MTILEHFNYWIVVVLLMVGLYAIVARTNLIKKVIGLAIVQNAVFLFYISLGNVTAGEAPILQPGHEDAVFSNPLPQVLILTAIVVGISTTALALSIVVRIREEYASVEEDEIRTEDLQTARDEAQAEGGRQR